MSDAAYEDARRLGSLSIARHCHLSMLGSVCPGLRQRSRVSRWSWQIQKVSAARNTARLWPIFDVG